MKIQLTQLEVIPGHPSTNTQRMVSFIEEAKAHGVDLIIFPEMCIPGYLIGDNWERESFLKDCEACGEQIRQASHGITVIFGNVAMDWSRKNEDGRVRKYNALFLAEDGRFIGPENGPYDFAPKTLMPNYREFDDSRHFYDTRKLATELSVAIDELIRPIPSRLGRLGGILCEDGWCMDYDVAPIAILDKQNCRMLINISCSPFTLNKNHKRNRVFSEHASRCGIPLAYVNNVGIQNNGKTVYTFDGGSCLYDGMGNQVSLDTTFSEAKLILDLPDAGHPLGDPTRLEDDGVAEIFKALQFGADRFMKTCGITRIVIGASGGIDSAVAAALYRTIMDPEDLLLVNMPGQYNSDTTKAIAASLAEALGCYYTSVPIEASVALSTKQFDGLRIKRSDGQGERHLELDEYVFENIQARDRSSRILAALAASFGGAFTCNANKSEMTVGYTTLYGDLGGFLAALGDLWKSHVYALGRYMNMEVYQREVIPEACFTIPPSAELSPHHNVDQGQGDPLIYDYHDCLFASWVERWSRATPEDALRWFKTGRLEKEIGYMGDIHELFPDARAFIADLEKWWRLYQGLAVAKRIQAPPILAVTRRAFGFDHRETQCGVYFSQAYRALKAEVLVEG
jgi:NAD+ synthase (glutamine-hydrolysing)